MVCKKTKLKKIIVMCVMFMTAVVSHAVNQENYAQYFRSWRREAVNMSGYDNGCGYFAILSQLYPKKFGGTKLSSIDDQLLEKVMRKVKKLREEMRDQTEELTFFEKGIEYMFDRSLMPFMANELERPLVMFGEKDGVLESVNIQWPFDKKRDEVNDLGVRCGLGLEVFFNGRVSLDTPLKELLNEKNSERLQELARQYNLSGEISLKSFLGAILKDPRVIALIHKNGNHFWALQWRAF